MTNELHIVTGAFGYSGKYIAARLLNEGHYVCTITNSVNRANPFGGKVEAHPFNFDAPEKLVESLRGATVLYNTSSTSTRFASLMEPSDSRIDFCFSLCSLCPLWLKGI